MQEVAVIFKPVCLQILFCRIQLDAASGLDPVEVIHGGVRGGGIDVKTAEQGEIADIGDGGRERSRALHLREQRKTQ